MRYLKETLRYIFAQGKGKHFGLLFLFSLLPAALLAHAVPIEIFLSNLISPPDYQWWGELWMAHLDCGYRSIFSIVVALLLTFVTTACICRMVIRHFRIGKLSFPNILNSANDNFLACLSYGLAKMGIYLVAYTIFTLFEYLWYSTCSYVVFIVLTSITAVVLLIPVIYITSSFTLWLPTMMIKGLHGKNAFTTALYQSRGKQKLFLPGKIFIVLLFVVSMILSYFFAKIWYVSWIINTVFYAVAYAFTLCHLVVVYFGENLLPREDLRKKPYTRRY